MSKRKRPEWVKCVRHNQVTLLGTSWCGRQVPETEWAFVDVNHAANSGQHGDRLMTCPECLAAITAALRNGYDE